MRYDRDFVLYDISFSVSRGEKIALVGLNGSGKTSLMNILLRFYSATQGDIYINGTNIKDIVLSEYRSKFSVVEQQTILFNGTVKENISMFSPIDKNTVLSTFKYLGINSLIKKLPKGIDTDIGVDGGLLSGGERQKIALARAILKPHEILILDEASSNFDIESEKMLQNLVFDKRNSKTVFMITHRPEVLKKADKILFLRESGIIAFDSYSKLLNNVDCRNILFNEQHRKGGIENGTHV